MMGGHHAATGAAAWVAVTGTASYTLGWYPLTGSAVVCGALVCAGAALLPDADHHNATIAHALPPLSRVLCAGVGRISGGHRHGTHSLLAVAVFTTLAWALGLVVVNVGPVPDVRVGAGLSALLLAAFAFKALRLLRGALAPWAASATFGVVVALSAPAHWSWLPAAVGLGVCAHIAGDMLTTGGVPLLWPWVPRPPERWARAPVLRRVWQPNGYMGLPVLGNAGSFREWLLLIPVSAYAVVGVLHCAWASASGVTPEWVQDIAERLATGSA